MTFAAQYWLYAIPLVFLLGIALERSLRKRSRAFGKFVDPVLWKVVAPELDWAARVRKTRVLCLSLVFVFLALARPQWGTIEEVMNVSGLDIMIAVDVSNSMETEDVVPSRLQKAQHWIRSLVGRLGGDRVGIIPFAASAFPLCPLTNDIGYVLESVEILSPSLIKNQGTDLATALEVALKALERGAEEPDYSRVLVLISDGEDHENRASSFTSALKERGIRLFVVGVGTAKGGPVPLRDDSGQLHGYKKDRRGNPVVSAFNATSLQKIAADAGGRYWDMSHSEGELDEVEAELKGLSRGEMAERRKVTRQERYQWPLSVAIFLLLLELTLPARKPRRESRLKRMGATALAGALFMTWTHSARASQLDDYLENESGLKAYGKGDLDEALKAFGSAQANDPNRPEFKLNQGAALYGKSEFEAAAKHFEEAAQGAAQRGDRHLEAISKFNLADAFLKAGNADGAMRSYLDAIDAAKAAKDTQLEQDARKNIELIQQEMQKQKQSGQSQDQKDQKDQKDQQDQQDQKDQKNDQSKDQDQKKKDPQQYQQTRKQRRGDFKSEKLSKEDAERVMAELSGRERELQKKLKKQKVGNAAVEKDW